MPTNEIAWSLFRIHTNRTRIKPTHSKQYEPETKNLKLQKKTLQRTIDKLNYFC